MGYNMYTDLDTLYDTRFELIRLINPYEADRILRDGSYHDRLTEVYGNIPYDVFYPLWKVRNKNLYIKANNTPMLQIIKDYFISLYGNEIYQEVKDDIKLYVNTYPYKFTEEERKITELFIAKFIVHCEIVTIYKSKKELTPKWVSDNIGTMFKYDYLDWLEYHVTEGDYNLGLKNVLACIPGVISGNVPVKAITSEEVMKLPDQHKFYANLDVIDVRNFSCLVKKPE